MFAYDQGQRIEPHTAPYPVFLSMLYGVAELTVGEEVSRLCVGEAVVVPAHSVRSMIGVENCSFLLVMLKGA